MMTASMRWSLHANVFGTAGSTPPPRSGWMCVRRIGAHGRTSASAATALSSGVWSRRFWPLPRPADATGLVAASHRSRPRGAVDSARRSYGPRFGPRVCPVWSYPKSLPLTRNYATVPRTVRGNEVSGVHTGHHLVDGTTLPRGGRVMLRAKLSACIFWHRYKNAESQQCDRCGH